jgi:hypothetical protein
MAKKAKRREWTASDILDLKSFAKKRTPAAKIAKSLKGTVGATRQKAFSLRFRWMPAGSLLGQPP